MSGISELPIGKHRSLKSKEGTIPSSKSKQRWVKNAISYKAICHNLLRNEGIPG